MIWLADKLVKTLYIYTYTHIYVHIYIFKNVILNMMKRENKDIKKIKVELLQSRNTISKMKNTLDENNPDAE